MIYDIPMVTLDGRQTTLAEYRNQVLLIVNVASRCGFTPQYAGLEALQRKYAPRGFAVLGFPCNQFARQEPGDAKEIRTFCSLNYDVTFPLFAKIDVNVLWGNGARGVTVPGRRFRSCRSPYASMMWTAGSPISTAPV